MKQSKFQSFVEASVNTTSGFIISYASTFIVFPLVGLKSSASQNFMSVALFTVISIIRSYVWRRVFNHIHSKSIQP